MMVLGQYSVGSRFRDGGRALHESRRMDYALYQIEMGQIQTGHLDMSAASHLGSEYYSGPRCEAAVLPPTNSMHPIRP